MGRKAWAVNDENKYQVLEYVERHYPSLFLQARSLAKAEQIDAMVRNDLTTKELTALRGCLRQDAARAKNKTKQLTITVAAWEQLEALKGELSEYEGKELTHSELIRTYIGTFANMTAHDRKGVMEKWGF